MRGPQQGCRAATRSRYRVMCGFRRCRHCRHRRCLPGNKSLPRAHAPATSHFLSCLACRFSDHPHEVHLLHRKSAVADKPTHAHFSPEHYTTAAPRRQASYKARSPPPFAAEQSSSPAEPAAPARYLQPHTPQPPSGKVGATAFTSEAYSSARQAAVAARQQRYAAAAGAQAPFAVKAGEGGVAEAAGVPAHLERPQQKDPAAKVRQWGRSMLRGVLCVAGAT